MAPLGRIPFGQDEPVRADQGIDMTGLRVRYPECKPGDGPPPFPCLTRLEMFSLLPADYTDRFFVQCQPDPPEYMGRHHSLSPKEYFPGQSRVTIPSDFLGGSIRDFLEGPPPPLLAIKATTECVAIGVAKVLSNSGFPDVSSLLNSYRQKCPDSFDDRMRQLWDYLSRTEPDKLHDIRARFPPRAYTIAGSLVLSFEYPGLPGEVAEWGGRL